MSSIVSREIHLSSRPDGMPVPANFSLQEQTLTPTDSDIVVQNLYMSVDPAMRPALSNGQMPLDTAMTGGAIGKVTQSASSDYRWALT